MLRPGRLSRRFGQAYRLTMSDYRHDQVSRRTLLGLSGGTVIALLAACVDGDGVRITETSGSSGRPAGDNPTTTTGSTGPGTATPTSSAHATTTAPTTADSATASNGSPVRRGAVNALLIGSDSRTSSLRPGNSDVITVVQLTADRQRLNLTLWPRTPLGVAARLTPPTPEEGPRLSPTQCQRCSAD